MLVPDSRSVAGQNPYCGKLFRRVDLSGSSSIFADVAIDIPSREIAEQLFTYEIPEALKEEVFVGSQVLVQFGHQDLVAGFVIALKDSPGETVSGEKVRIKPILEVLETESLFDKSYISFLHWVADYYCATISEVISAAIPTNIGPRRKRVVRLIAPGTNGETIRPGQQELLSVGINPFREASSEQKSIINALENANKQALSVKALRERSGLSMARFYANLAKLRQEGLVKVECESSQQTAPKMRSFVLWTGEVPSTKRQSEVVAALKRAGGKMPLQELLEAASTTSDTIKRMCGQGTLTLTQEEIWRDPLKRMGYVGADGEVTIEKAPELRPAQALVFEKLTSALAEKLTAGPSEASDQPWLLHGVTGSGKTEIYLRLIAECLSHDRSVLMMVPEISLTPQLAQRLISRFGNKVAIWHSGLSAGERYDTWRRLRAGDARILLGARSAMLAFLPDLGLIILDEEHDGSYKQSSPSPRYHARTLSMERARREGALVLLGSATPDVSTYLSARKHDRILQLPERIHQQPLPKSTLIDMRLEFASGNRTIFSRPLCEALQRCLERQEQAILLINRRGYASHVFCRACGYVVKCRNCSVSLVYHQTASHPHGYLVCHHCAFSAECSETCPACKSPFIRQFGLGTQRVEQETRELFPNAKLLRLDSDITSRRGAYEEIFKQFSAGEADILIGTQIVAKGLDIPRVTLVGVLAADAAFNLPDYRSLERGFQLLTQVSGRAGRGHDPGRVVLQAFSVDLPALRLSQQQDYLSFAEQELVSREEFGYPPFSELIRIVTAADRSEIAEYACEQLAEEISHLLEDKFPIESVRILGPAPCVIERLRGKYRFHLIIKNFAGQEARKMIGNFLKRRRGVAGLSVAIDIDPVDLV